MPNYQYNLNLQKNCGPQIWAKQAKILFIAQAYCLGQFIASSRAEKSKKIVAQIRTEMIFSTLMFFSIHSNLLLLSKSKKIFSTTIYQKSIAAIVQQLLKKNPFCSFTEQQSQQWALCIVTAFHYKQYEVNFIGIKVYRYEPLLLTLGPSNHVYR